jgi:hypothetical protein
MRTSNRVLLKYCIARILQMQAKNSFFTVVVRPIPRGIIKDDLVSQHLSRFGQVKNVRFSDAKGSAGDVMYVDYFDMPSAVSAVRGLHGTKDPGTSNLTLTALLSKASQEAANRALVLDSQAGEPEIKKKAVSHIQVNASIRYLKPKGAREGICILDLGSITDE